MWDFKTWKWEANQHRLGMGNSSIENTNLGKLKIEKQFTAGGIGQQYNFYK